MLDEDAVTLLLGIFGRKRAAAAIFMQAMLAWPDGTNGFDRLDPSQRQVILDNAGPLLAALRARPGEALTDAHPRALACPVTEIVGEKSALMLLAAMDREASLVPTMRVVRVAEGNHLMPHERPAEFVRVFSGALLVAPPPARA